MKRCRSNPIIAKDKEGYSLEAGSWKLEAGSWKLVCKAAAVNRKPNSVRLRSPPFGVELGVTIIPLAPPSLTGSSGLPGSFERAVLIALPYLALLRAGFSLPPVLPRARCALTAPFHHCLPACAGVSCVFSVPLSFGLPRPGVTRRTALRSSDFPPASARFARFGAASPLIMTADLSRRSSRSERRRTIVWFTAAVFFNDQCSMFNAQCFSHQHWTLNIEH